MSATYPPVYSPFADAEFDLNAPVTEESVRKLAQNLNMLSKLAFIGSYRALHLGIPGVDVPSTAQFHYCDGSEILDTTSPLSTQGSTQHFTPNLINKYIVAAASTSANNTVGGDINNLAHNHTGFTGGTEHQHTRIAEDGDKHDDPGYDHNHTISSDLNAAEPINPAYLNLGYYIKIN
jgi:hypothetical protein